MFERFTEKARRVIFFARYEASQFGSPYIETEHLLLGLLREDKALTNRFFRSYLSVKAIRNQIEAHAVKREKVSTSVDVPLSSAGKRVLAYAAEEAEKLRHRHIGTEHLLLGLLREEKSFAAEILEEYGLKAATVRAELARTAQIERPPGMPATATTAGMFGDLSRAAIDGKLGPIVGRDVELDSVVEILCTRRRRNPLLVGPRGTGKAAVVEGLALRISEGRVPGALAYKKILSMDAKLLTNWAAVQPRPGGLSGVFRRESGSEEHGFSLLTKLLSEDTSLDQIILFVENFHEILAAPAQAGSGDARSYLVWALNAGVQCMGASDAESMEATTRADAWLSEFFRIVHVRPLGADDLLQVLAAHKAELEKYHEVTYSDDALLAVVRSPYGAPGEASSTAKALELLDAAGAAAKMNRGPDTPEIAEARKKVKSISDRMESAIINHEFEKARLYSDEERKERENLRALEEKAGSEAVASLVVTAEDVERVVARWSGYPYSA